MQALHHHPLPPPVLLLLLLYHAARKFAVNCHHLSVVVGTDTESEQKRERQRQRARERGDILSTTTRSLRPITVQAASARGTRGNTGNRGKTKRKDDLDDLHELAVKSYLRATGYGLRPLQGPIHILHFARFAQHALLTRSSFVLGCCAVSTAEISLLKLLLRRQLNSAARTARNQLFSPVTSVLSPPRPAASDQ